MKFFIVGLHSSGKQEVMDILEKHGINCGHLFSNIDTPKSEIYNSYNYELYSTMDINEIFENNFNSVYRICLVVKERSNRVKIIIGYSNNLVGKYY